MFGDDQNVKEQVCGWSVWRTEIVDRLYHVDLQSDCIYGSPVPIAVRKRLSCLDLGQSWKKSIRQRPSLGVDWQMCGWDARCLVDMQESSLLP
jgi:hypothetical protein